MCIDSDFAGQCLIRNKNSGYARPCPIIVLTCALTRRKTAATRTPFFWSLSCVRTATRSARACACGACRWSRKRGLISDGALPAGSRPTVRSMWLSLFSLSPLFVLWLRACPHTRRVRGRSTSADGRSGFGLSILCREVAAVLWAQQPLFEERVPGCTVVAPALSPLAVSSILFPSLSMPHTRTATRTHTLTQTFCHCRDCQRLAWGNGHKSRCVRRSDGQ